jgi:hypothetical protein
MSKLSYQLSVKKYQKELGLDARTFNALDVKYDDINLLKQLQILNPVIAVPASAPKTGFWGSINFINDDPDSYAVDIILQTIDGATYNTIYTTTVNVNDGDNGIYITEANRFLSPTTIIKLSFSVIDPPSGYYFDLLGYMYSDIVDYSETTPTIGWYTFTVENYSFNINDGGINFSMNVHD